MDDLEAKKAKAEELFALGVGATEVGRILGVPRSTVWGWHQRGNPDAPPPVDAIEAKEMEIAALRQQLKIAEGTRPDVVPAYVPPESHAPEAKWKLAEEDNAEHIRKALLMAHFSVELPDDKPVAICFVSDQHISIGNCVDLRRMREDAELIGATDGAYAVLGGDGVDNHIKHRAAVLAARSQPQDQYELFEWYLQIFAHRILVAISGNHDLWTNQIAGVDAMGSLCKRSRVCYAPDEALLNVRLGSQQYKVGVRHQFRMNSSLNETHSCKQWFRFGESQWDIGCIGHHHVSAVEPFWGHGVERWACRPGSYQITSAYSRQFGFNSTRPLCPTFVIYPDKRKIVGFHDLQDGVNFLKAVRG